MRNRHFLAGLFFYCILLLTALTYWQGLQGPWLLDDMSNLGALSLLDNPNSEWQDIIFSNRSGLLGRPISVLSFILDYKANGLLPCQFKFTNLMLHLLCTCLVFWLILEIGKGLNERRIPLAAALVGTAFWAFAPLLVSTVLYAVQRMAQLSCLFSLAGLLAYAHGRSIVTTRPWIGKCLMVSSVLLWLPLASLSKENGILLPYLLFCTEFYVFRFRGNISIRKWLKTYFAAFCILPSLAAALWLLSHPQIFLNGYSLREFNLSQRLMTEPRVISDYVIQFILPNGGRMGLYHDDFPLSSSILEPPSTLLMALALLGSVLASIRATSIASRALAFGWLFFLTGHLLESTIFSLEIYFEHRNYLPSIGLASGIALGLDQTLRTPNNRQRMLAAGVLFTIISATATYQRTGTWRDYDLMLESAIKYHPGSYRLLSDLAVRRAQHGNIGLALKTLEQSLKLAPSIRPAEPIARLALICIARTQVEITDYAFQPVPTDWRPLHAPIVFASSALGHLNSLLTKEACPSIDKTRLITGLNLLLASMPVDHMKGNFENWTLFFEAARTATLTNDQDAFIRYLQTAMKIDPTRPEAGASLIVYFLNQDRREQALATFDAMQAANPAPDRRFSEDLLRLKSMLWPQTD